MVIKRQKWWRKVCPYPSTDGKDSVSKKNVGLDNLVELLKKIRGPQRRAMSSNNKIRLDRTKLKPSIWNKKDLFVNGVTILSCNIPDCNYVDTFRIVSETDAIRLLLRGEEFVNKRKTEKF